MPKPNDSAPASNSAPARRVTPKTWAVATAAALSVAAPLVPLPGFSVTAQASETGEAGEAGEGGEAGVALQEGTAGFLTNLGLFEAAHRIVGALYQRGDYALALEQLEVSHHAHYEDLVSGINDSGAPEFAEQTQAFAAAVAQQATTEVVAARLSALLTAIDAARAAAEPTARERLLALKTLLDIAAADYAGGVEDGAVVLDIEYRDAWGFVETVRARAQALAAGSDPALAEAGAEILTRLAPLSALFPDLLATETTGDPAALAAAAAWVEIIALRQS